MEFKVIDGEPGLDLNSGEEGVTGVQPYMNEVMSMNELSGMDEVEFQLHEHAFLKSGVALGKVDCFRGYPEASPTME